MNTLQQQHVDKSTDGSPSQTAHRAVLANYSIVAVAQPLREVGAGAGRDEATLAALT